MQSNSPIRAVGSDIDVRGSSGEMTKGVIATRMRVGNTVRYSVVVDGYRIFVTEELSQ